MGEVRGPEGRGRKAGRDARDHHRPREEFVPPKQESRKADRYGSGNRNREHRLAVSPEKKRDPGSEGDGNPRQQPHGVSLGARPFAQFFEDARPNIKAGSKATRPRRTAWRPSLRNTLHPA